MEHPHTIPSLMEPGSDMVFLQGTCVGQANERHGWFCRLPGIRQAQTPALNCDFKEKLLTDSHGDNNEAIIPQVETGCSQRRFLVFDQSGDQTTLIFSSGFGTSVPCLGSCCPKTTGACNLTKDDPETKESLNIELREASPDKFDDKDGTDLQSEMHEDTDELNALLYSDDDSDYAEDDEVTSTGHSPSTMTFLYDQDCFNGSTKEVASSGCPTKKRKFFDGDVYGVIPDVMDTASSLKAVRSLELEDDAESRSDNGLYQTSGEVGSEFCNKKMRKERIQETLSILQDIIPDGKGKNAIVVLEEAISYLKSLKIEAKLLGVDVP